MCYSALVKRDLDYLGPKFGATLVREQPGELFSSSEPLRIYPKDSAPVIWEKDGKRIIEPMRYSAFPPANMPDDGKYTTFNARRDNLASSFWSEAFLKHHGLVVLEGFYEWVAVSDLLKAGVATIDDVKAEFARQTEERKAKILAAGKKYKPTPTELKDPRFRKIVIQFDAGQPLLVPVIFSIRDGQKGFAIVTDDPPLEVLAAGHDRCPILLNESTIARWLRPQELTAQDADRLLAEKEKVTFGHAVAVAV